MLKFIKIGEQLINLYNIKFAELVPGTSNAIAKLQMVSGEVLEIRAPAERTALYTALVAI